MNDFDLSTTLRQVCRTTPQLSRLSAGIRNHALSAMAKALHEHGDNILEANTLDLEQLRGQQLPAWIVEGVKMTPERIHKAAQQLDWLAHQPDPIGIVETSWKHERRLLFNCYRVPLGVIALVYEIYCEFAVNGLGMGLKTGNGVVLCASSEVSQTHLALVNLLAAAAYQAGIPEGAIQSLPGENLWSGSEGVPPLLRQSRYLDLVIPHGRPSWVERIQEISTVPLLLTGLGQGTVFIDAQASWTQVRGILLEQPKTETTERRRLEQLSSLWLLIHQDWAGQHLDALIQELIQQNYEFQINPALQERYPHLPSFPTVIDSTAGSCLRLSVVDNLTEAITWINKHSFHQVEAIVTDSRSSSLRFSQEVEAAVIYLNSLPLPSDSYELEQGSPLGISIQKFPRRGWINLSSLTASKVIAQPGP